MVSGRQMEGLLDMARREDARILFSGDTRQIQSVESSDALRILERESRMTSVSLTGIQRQSNLEYRAAIETFRQSPDQGFAKLQDLGAVREVPYIERAQAVAVVYREMTPEPGRKVLVVAPTHEEIGRVTQAIREDLKQRSVLGDGETLQRHIPSQWTEAQKKDISNYQPDQVLVFHRASHGIEKHEAITVTGVSGSTIHAMNERGKAKSVSLTQARSFSVHERREIEVAAGDKLLLMGNRKEPGFRATNGELTTVRSVERGIINLFFLRVSNDQVSYMSSILQPSELLRRMEIYVEDETRAGRLPKGSFPLLREALFAGEFERGLAPSLTGYKERMARTVVSKLLDAGLLVSPSHVARLRLGFPLPVVERWFPALYPSSSYRFYV